MVRKVKVEEAVGEKLAHDVIRYGPDLKSVAFKRGHVITLEDIEKLKDSGDYFVFVEEGKVGGVHEEEAATRMARASTDGSIFFSRPSQGKVNLLAKTAGLLKVKKDVVKRVNLEHDFIFATKRSDILVRKGGLVGSVKIVPLWVEEGRLKKVEMILRRSKPVVKIVPVKVKKIGLVITGTEVYEGRIKDAFEPILSAKLAEYGLKIRGKIIVPDDEEKIMESILKLKQKGHDLILVASGMAVDAGDVTPVAIRKTGADVVSRGVPIFPGSMAMIAHLGDTLIMGLPACVIPDKVTSFDVLLPRMLAKEKITREELAELGHGGIL
jgi:molybdenum cofactor synthesis domain-containing protein